MPSVDRPLRVFLCHAHADRDPVRGLYSRLTKDGVAAWFDKEKLLPGQDWELEIRKAVREADVVVVCLSKHFKQAGFRQKEVKLALETAMEQPEGEIFIVPARLEECDTLESLRKWHQVDLFEEDGYEMLMRALRTRADKVGVTLRIKKKRAPKKINQEKRIFYDLTAHYECDFENTTPEILANFLFETLTRIMRNVSGVDKTDNSRTAEYQTSQVEYLDPKDGKTNQHAIIVHGKKVRYTGKGNIQGFEPLAIVSEMLIITVTQGINHSRLRFDSNELPSDAFKSLVEWILADIGKNVSVVLKNASSQKTPIATIVINDGYPQILWDATDALQSGESYISIAITSKENRLIKCRCYIKSLELDGILRDDLKHELVKHTNRVSWSGGSDEEVGVKHIDPRGFGRINLASLDSKDIIRRPLQFEMAKGAQSKDKDGKFLPFGNYVIDLGLACNDNGADLPEIPIRVGFEYFVDESLYEDKVIKDGRAIQRILRLVELKSANNS